MQDIEKDLNNNKANNYGLNDELKAEILSYLEADSKAEVNKAFSQLHPADQADFISSISSDVREKLISIITYGIDPQFLTYLENDVKNEVIEFLGAKASAKAIGKLMTDDAVEVMETLEDEGIDEILKLVSKEKRSKIEKTLSYSEFSVGRIMHQDFVSIKKDWTVGQATKYFQEQPNLPDNLNYIVIVDDNLSPISEVLLSKMIKSVKNTKISTIMNDEEDFRKLSVDMDQEDAAKLFSKYSLAHAPVVDENDQLVGVIYAGDVIDIMEEEAEEDILLLGGVNESNLYSSPLSTAGSRIPWLFTGLLTTAMAVTIIAIFSHQIEKAVALAVLLPIVASISGNSGTQALTVMVRAIATDDISNIGALRVLSKEVLVGSFSGLVLAVCAATLCYFWKYDLNLSIVLAASIFCTVIIAGFCGAAIPLLLSKLNFDPAISSGVFLVAIADSVSFFIFLGLASLFMF